MNTVPGTLSPSKILGLAALLGFLAFPAAHAAEKPVLSEPAPASYGVKELEKETEESPGPSVNLREEFTFSSHRNIDSFLGEFENPYAPLPDYGDESEEEAPVSGTRPPGGSRF